MIENLKDIFSNVNEWLKFAEAKNAGLAVLNAAFIFGSISVLTQNDVTIPQHISYYLYSLIIFSGLGSAIALYSFWPQTQIDKDLRRDSVLFFGSIKNYSPESYLNKLKEANKKENKEFSDLELDYANQAIMNSRITFRKYSYFKIALFLTISALITPIFSIILIFVIKIINYFK